MIERQLRHRFNFVGEQAWQRQLRRQTRIIVRGIAIARPMGWKEFAVTSELHATDGEQDD